MKIGYIGLGALGHALARRFLPEHELTVWDLDRAAAAPFKELGATIAANAPDLARRCEVVLLCLPRSSDVQEAIFGPGGLAEGLLPGQLVVDQTSGAPAQTREIAEKLAERGVAMIDAAVSGNPGIVAEGRATLMASGPDEAYERALPVLRVIAANIHRCGTRVGDGQAMKTVNNALNAGCRLATLELAAMGRKMGLSLDCITDVVNKGSGRNRTSQVMLPALMQGKASTDFALSLMLKDLSQAVALGMDHNVPMPISTVVRGLLQIGVSTLGENARLEQIVGLVESMAGTRLVPPGGGEAAPSLLVPARDAKGLTVGYVGLGTMGGALARRLMLSRKMHVFDTRPEAALALESEGAIAHADLPSLARACDVIMICVPTSAVVRKVLFGPGGLAEGLSAGKIVIDQTTGDPTETRAIAADLQKIGIPLVDAPVSGGPRGAVAGTIAIMCGGPAAEFAQVRPILESISPNVVYCGPTGNGHVAKLVNNAVASCNRLLTYECAMVGFKYGLSIADMDKVINSSSGWNGGSERILKVLAAHGKSADFQLALMVKDLRLAARMGMDGAAPMMVAGAVRTLFEIGATRLGGTRNLDDMALLFEEMAGATFGAT